MNTPKPEITSGVKVDQTNNGHLIVRESLTNEEFWVEWPKSPADGSSSDFPKPAKDDIVHFELIDGTTKVKDKLLRKGRWRQPQEKIPRQPAPQSETSTRGPDLNSAEFELAERMERIGERELQLNELTNALDQRAKQMSDEEVQLTKRQSDLNKYSDELSKREVQLAAVQSELPLNWPTLVRQMPNFGDDPSLLQSHLVREFSDPSEDQRTARGIMGFLLASTVGQILIFAGPPGSGKSVLARRIPHLLGARCSSFAVRPAWIDPSDLLGFADYTRDRFIPTQFLIGLKEAFQTPDQFHCMLLEEMNLAHVENYAADLLVAIDRGLGRVTDPSPKLSLYPKGQFQDQDFDQEIELPRNVVISGTLNHDETTRRLSPKLKDRGLFVRLSFSDSSITGWTSPEIPLLSFSPDLAMALSAVDPDRSTVLWDRLRRIRSKFTEYASDFAEQALSGPTVEESAHNLKTLFPLSARIKRCFEALPVMADFLGLPINHSFDLLFAMKILPHIETYADHDNLLKPSLGRLALILRDEGCLYSSSELDRTLEESDSVISYLR